MEVRLSNQLPGFTHLLFPVSAAAPDRGYSLTPAQNETALKNALVTFPKSCMKCWLRSLWKS